MTITITIEINEAIDIQVENILDCSIREWIHDNISLRDLDFNINESTTLTRTY